MFYIKYLTEEPNGYEFQDFVTEDGGRGDSHATLWGGDARRKISMEPLRSTNLGVAQVDFKP